MRISKRVRTLLSAGMLLAYATSAAAATDEERATARSLANQGVNAFKAKRFGEAADLFQRAESLVHSPVHLLYLGRSYANTGKLVRAQEAFLQATREELTASSPAAFSKAVDEAVNELEAIKPRLAQLTITLSGLGDQAKPEVSIDGEAIPAVMVGVPVPMDPGQHRVEAKAPRYLSTWRKITLAEGQSEAVRLELTPDPAAAEVPEEPTGDPSATPGTGEPPISKRPAEDSDGNPVFLYTSLGAMAIGLGGLGLGTYDLLKAFDARDKGNALYNQCEPSTTAPNRRLCDDNVIAQIGAYDSEDERYRNRAIVPYIVGGVGLALGTTLLILWANSTGSPSKSTAAQTTVYPWIGAGSAGVFGQF